MIRQERKEIVVVFLSFVVVGFDVVVVLSFVVLFRAFEIESVGLGV